MPLRVRHALVSLVAATLAASEALAQPQPPPAPPPLPAAQPGDGTLQEARRAYDEGSTHYVAGRYEDALIAFERAYSLRPNPVVLMPILECHDHLGHVPEAIRTLETYLRAVPEGRNRPLLEARLANLRQRPARVHILTTPAGATVRVDGSEVAAHTPTYVELPEGRHTLTATLTGYLPATHEFETLPGTARDELLSMEPDPAAATPSGPTPPTTRTPPPRSVSPIVWVSAGLGGAALIAGTTFGVLALSDNNLYDREPTRETRDRGLRYALLADVSFGVALASGALALVVYFLERRASNADARPTPAAAAAPHASVRLLPGALRVDF